MEGCESEEEYHAKIAILGDFFAFPLYCVSLLDSLILGNALKILVKYYSRLVFVPYKKARRRLRKWWHRVRGVVESEGTRRQGADGGDDDDGEPGGDILDDEMIRRLARAAGSSRSGKSSRFVSSLHSVKEVNEEEDDEEDQRGGRAVVSGGSDASGRGCSGSPSPSGSRQDSGGRSSFIIEGLRLSSPRRSLV